MNQQGNVTEVTSRSGVSKTGKPYTMYGLMIDGQRWGLENPFNPPACHQGDVITFFGAPNQQGYNTASSIVVTGAAATTGSAPAAQPAGQAPMAQPAPPVRVDNRQVSIEYQCCMKTAAWVLPIMLEQEAVSLPKSAKTAAKYDIINALYKELVDTHYLQLQAVKEAGGVQVEDILPDPEGV